MRTAMHLRSLTDEELIAVQRQTLDLVATDLERELALRLANAIDTAESNTKEVTDLEARIEDLEAEITKLEKEHVA